MTSWAPGDEGSGSAEAVTAPGTRRGVRAPCVTPAAPAPAGTVACQGGPATPSLGSSVPPSTVRQGPRPVPTMRCADPPPSCHLVPSSGCCPSNLLTYFVVRLGQTALSSKRASHPAGNTSGCGASFRACGCRCAEPALDRPPGCCSWVPGVPLCVSAPPPTSCLTVSEFLVLPEPQFLHL